jgi:hypothetical protein
MTRAEQSLTRTQTNSFFTLQNTWPIFNRGT